MEKRVGEQKSMNESKRVGENYLGDVVIVARFGLKCVPICLLSYYIVGENSTWRKQYVRNISFHKKSRREVPGWLTASAQIFECFSTATHDTHLSQEATREDTSISTSQR